MGARVSTSAAGDRTVFHLHDDATGATASVLPSYGFNLFDLRLPLAGAVRPIVVADDGWAANPSRPARNGFPVLFPFAGRIREARFSYGGREYDLVPNKPPHAIHGFALDAPWDVIDHSVGLGGATIAGRFRISKNAPGALDRWPADAVLEVRYTLAGARLALDATVANPSAGPLPWSFGLHSYFALPFDRRDDRSRTKVVVPASESWTLQDALPTGERRSVSGTEMDYRRGRSVAGLEADVALTGLSRERGEEGVCRLVDEGLGGELLLVFDRRFREVVVFTPPGSPGVIAVEPYTAMADPFYLREMGVDPGLDDLPPGGSRTMSLAFEATG